MEGEERKATICKLDGRVMERFSARLIHQFWKGECELKGGGVEFGVGTSFLRQIFGLIFLHF